MQQEHGNRHAAPSSFHPGQRIRNVSRTLVVSMTPIIRAGLAMIASCCTIMSCIINVPRSAGSPSAIRSRRKRSEKNCSSMIITKQKADSANVGTGSLSRNRCWTHNFNSKRSPSRKSTSSR